MAANAFRGDCTRTSSTLPCWSTARHRKWIVPLIFDDDFIEMPRVAGPGPAPAQPVGVDLPELRAPLPDGSSLTTTPRCNINSSSSRKLSGNR